MPHADLAVGAQISHFRILPRLGEGGMGTVYRALDLRLDREVALKFISPQWMEDPLAVGRFQREARLASQFLRSSVLPEIHKVREAVVRGILGKLLRPIG